MFLEKQRLPCAARTSAFSCSTYLSDKPQVPASTRGSSAERGSPVSKSEKTVHTWSAQTNGELCRMALVSQIRSHWATSYSSCSLLPIRRSNLGLKDGELRVRIFPQNAFSFFCPSSTTQRPSSRACQYLLSVNFHCVGTQAGVTITRILPGPVLPISASEESSWESVTSFLGSNEQRGHH